MDPDVMLEPGKSAIPVPWIPRQNLFLVAHIYKTQSSIECRGPEDTVLPESQA